MSKAFCMIMLIGLGVAATPALAQGPKHNADKVRDQIERRDRDRVRHDDRDDDRDRDRERRRDIFTRASGDAISSQETSTAVRPDGIAARRRAGATVMCLRGRQKSKDAIRFTTTLATLCIRRHRIRR